MSSLNHQGRWLRLGRLFELFPFSHYVLLSLLFFAGLELISVFHAWVWLVSGILLVLVGFGIVLIRIEERGYFHPTQIILPVLAAVGLTGFSFFLSSGPWLHLYFAASALMLFFLMKHGARQAYPTWNWVISVIVLALGLAIIFGWRFFLYIPVLLVLVPVMAVVWLVGIQSLQRVAPSLREAILLAGTIGFALTEVGWVLLFLPLHYLIQAGLLVALYYVFFHLVSISYERKLTRHDIMEYVTIGLVAFILVLTTARWT